MVSAKNSNNGMTWIAVLVVRKFTRRRSSGLNRMVLSNMIPILIDDIKTGAVCKHVGASGQCVIVEGITARVGYY